MGIENPVHIIFIGIVALLVLGPKRLPEVARALGQGIREFRESVSQGGEPPVVQHTVVQQPPAPPATQPPAPEPSTVVQQAPVSAGTPAPEAVVEPAQAPSPVPDATH